MTEREHWLVNFYRNSELHGALLMGRLGRTLHDTDLLCHATRHCATEARHAALLGEAIQEARGRIDPAIRPVQEYYSMSGGMPKALPDLLVLSEILEHRVLATYRAHLERHDVDPVVRRTLTEIAGEMEAAHGGDHAGWIDQALAQLPPGDVEAAGSRWRAIDREVAADLVRSLDQRFPPT